MTDTYHPDARCHWCGGRFWQAVVNGTALWLCETEECATRQWAYAVGTKDRKGQMRWLYVPTPKQVEFESCQAPNRLFGGAAGGAKSHAMRWGLYRDCLRLPNLECLIVRQTFPELERTHLRRMARDAPLIGATFHETKRLMTFPNGSFIEAGHLDDANALQKYLSTEYDRIRDDEASLTPGPVLLELSSRARTPLVPEKRAILTEGGANFGLASNPGGPGAAFLLDFFIDHTPDLEQYPGLAERGAYDPAEWAFIPAKLSDNPYMDPVYRRRLASLPAVRRKQLEDGDWRVFTGQFFPEWSEAAHVREVRADWANLRVFVSLDWGYNAPGCALWWTCLSDGHFHIVQEYKFNGPVSQRVTVKEVSEELIRRSQLLGMRTCPLVYADPAVDQHTGQVGESIRETFQRWHIPMLPSNNDRVNGWQRIHELLRTAPDGTPWLTVDPNCRYLIRTIAAAVQKDSNPEDLDTETDDHALDACFPADAPIRTETGDRPILDLRVGDRVWTRKGLKPVEAVFRAGHRPLLAVTLNTGATVVGTPDHRVWVGGGETPGGFVPLSEVRYGDIMWPCIPTITATAPAGSGVEPTARFPRSITSIIGMAIRRITRWRTSPVFLRPIISRRMGVSIRARLASVRRVVKRCWLFPINASARTPVSPVGVVSNAWTMSRVSVRPAVVPSPSIVTTPPVTVPHDVLALAPTSVLSWPFAVPDVGTASPQDILEPAGVRTHVVSVRSAPAADVYNITVADEHEYFAYGVLVANCRYGAMSWPAASHRVNPSRIIPGSLADWTRERETTGLLSPRTAHA